MKVRPEDSEFVDYPRTTDVPSELRPPTVPSPYLGKHLSVANHLAISCYWFATNFLWGALLIPILPYEIGKLAGRHKAQTLGLVLGLAAVVALVVPLIAGALSDRCTAKWGRRKPFIAIGVAINVVGLGLMYVSYTQRNLFAYGLALMLVQFGNNVASAAYSGFIPDLIPVDQRGAASGFMAFMAQSGTLAGVFLIGVVLKHFDSAVKYAVVGSAMTLITLVTLFGVKENPLTHRPPKIDWLDYVKSLWIDPRQHPDFAWVWITRALVMLGFYIVVPFLTYYLGDVIRVADPAATSSEVIAIVIIGSIFSGLLGGYLSDIVGRKRVVYAANSLIALMALGLIFCRNVEQVILVGVLFGLGYGAYVSVDWAMGTDVLPSKDDAAKDMAVWHIAMTLPQSIGGAAGGLILGFFGSTVVKVAGQDDVVHYNFTGYAAMFCLCAACFALGAYLLKNVRGVK